MTAIKISQHACFRLSPVTFFRIGGIQVRNYDDFDRRLDQAQFLRDLRSPELQQRLAADVATANAAHVAATSTFFLNGHHVEESIPPSADVFAKLIDAELQHAK